MLCGKCAKVCPKDAVDYFQEPIEMEFESLVVIMATGFKLTSIEDKRQYGQGKLKKCNNFTSNGKTTCSPWTI